MIEEDRIFSPDKDDSDKNQDWSIRPSKFDEYFGQPEVAEQMQLFINAAKKRGDKKSETLLRGKRQDK